MRVLSSAPQFRLPDAQVAQLVEQRTENPRVGGSIPSLGTIACRLSGWAIGISAIARLRHEAARRGSTIAEVTREAIDAHLANGGRRRLIAAKAGRSGLCDTARHIENIIRRETRQSR